MKCLFAFVVIMSTFCTGFTWGKSHEESCKEAIELVSNQQRKAPETIPDSLEIKVTELCPNGAAQQFLLGVKNELGKRPDQAVLNYDNAIKIDEHMSEAYGRKGLIELSRGNKSAAMTLLTRALENGGKHPRYHLALAEILLETNAYPLILYHYEKANSQGYPHTADTLKGMATAYAGLNNWKEAEVATRQALFFSPVDPQLKSSLARIVMRQQRLHEGIQLLQQASGLKPDDKSIHRELADAYTAAGNLDEAQRELKLAGVPALNEVESLVQQGDTAFLRRNFPAAIRNYKGASDRLPTPEIFQKLGDAYLEAGNDDEALKSYQKSLAIVPDDPAVHYSAGVIYERKGEVGKAISEYERCVVLDKNNGDAHRRLAEIYLLKGDLQKAIAEFRILIEKAPENPAMHFRLAKVYLRANKLNEAKKCLETAVKLDPKNFEPRRELIKVEIRRKDLSSAEKLCRGILADDRDDQLERKRLIGILGQQKEYNELISFLKDEINRYPNESANYYRLGIVKEYLKDYRSAIKSFLKSSEITPTAQTYQALARAYLGVSETGKAKEALALAKKIDPKKKEVKELIGLIEDELDHPNADSLKKSGSKKKK